MYVIVSPIAGIVAKHPLHSALSYFMSDCQKLSSCCLLAQCALGQYFFNSISLFRWMPVELVSQSRNEKP